MKKRILVNLLISYLNTIAILVRDFIRLEVLDDHTYFAWSWSRYVVGNLPTLFIITPAIFLLLVHLPYNVVILYLGVNRLPYLKKAAIFFFILIIVLCGFGLSTNVMAIPYWKNLYYLVYFIPCSLISAAIIHYYVDTKEKSYWVKRNAKTMGAWADWQLWSVRCALRIDF